jgi:SAM-dependent methyltransferase
MMMNTPALAPTDMSARPSPAHRLVCPWWLGPFLASPVRRLLESPERLLQPFVRPGMTVVEPGCGMGFFSLPLARMVGPEGKVMCVDVQPRMIAGLVRRARRAGLLDRIHASVGSADAGLGAAAGTADVAILFHVLHEVPDQAPLLARLHEALRPGGLLLLIEPRAHVSADEFAASLEAAHRAGFRDTTRTVVARGLSAVLERAGDGDSRG